jgi:transcriptional regulator
MTFDKKAGLLQGTVELLVLKALSLGPMHGYGIASWIEKATDDVLSVEEGSLYPALYRMTRKGWIRGEWGVSDNNRRAKFYSLTKKGHKQLAVEERNWEQMVELVARFFQSAS